MFVSSHGGQSEIVLRVKQGDNPTFGFLMPDNHLHAYFRYLVDHPNLLNEHTYPKEPQDKTAENQDNTEPIAAGGALSLLGSAYDSGDDDAVASQRDLKERKSDMSGTPGNRSPCRSKHVESSTSIVSEYKETSKIAIDNDGVPLYKRIPMMKYASFSAPNCSKGGDTRPSARGALGGSQVSDIKPLLVEPPSVLKEAIDKIAEFILRNGKQFEAVLIEQDKSTGRFPFLLPSNEYNSYYLRRLEEEHESKQTGENISERKHDAHGHGASKKGKLKSPNKESDAYDSDLGEKSEGSSSGLKMTEKFKTITGGANKYTHERPPRQPRLSADDVAAIILSATRGSSPASADQHPTPSRQSGASTDEAAAIVLAATRGTSPANADQLLVHGKQHGVVATRGMSPAKVGRPPNLPSQFAVNTAEDARISVRDSKGPSPSNSLKSMLIEELHASRRQEDSGQYSSSRSFSSFEGHNTLSTSACRGENDKSLPTGKRDRNSSNIASDVVVAKIIANTVALAATNEADSDQACLTKEQKQKAERLKRAKIFAAVIKSGTSAVSDSGLSREVPSGSLMVSNDVSHSSAELKICDKKREVPFDSGNLDKMKSQERDNRENRARKAYLSRSREKLDVSDEDCSTARKRYRSTHYPHENRDNHRHHKYHHASRDKEVRHHKHHSGSEDEYKHRKRSNFPHRYTDDSSENDDHDEQIRSDIRSRKQRSLSGKEGAESRVKTLDHRDNLVGSSKARNPIASDAPPTDVTEVPTELRDKIRAMLLERM